LEIGENLLDQNLPAMNLRAGEDVGEWTTELSESLFINEKQERLQKQEKSWRDCFSPEPHAGLYFRELRGT
jgi:hypothetical protein